MELGRSIAKETRPATPGIELKPLPVRPTNIRSPTTVTALNGYNGGIVTETEVEPPMVKQQIVLNKSPTQEEEETELDKLLEQQQAELEKRIEADIQKCESLPIPSRLPVREPWKV